MGSASSSASTAKLYVIGTLVASVMTLGSVLFLYIKAPDNPGAPLAVISIMFPVISALLSGALHGVAIGLDGINTQLLQATAEKERAKGVLDGLQANPNTNVTEVPPKGLS